LVDKRKLGLTNKKDHKIDLDDLRIHDHKCFATFAGDKGELIVQLSRTGNDDILKF